MKKRTLYYLPPFVAECKKGCVIGSNHIRLMLVYQVRVRDPNLEPRNVIFISTIIHPTDSMLLEQKKENEIFIDYKDTSSIQLSGLILIEI